AGPIIIGQACEFDYSGTQALKALKEEGYKVILVNSNPATIMTDPGFAARTYIEPIKKAEDRDLFKEAMRRIGLDLPRSGYARSMRDAVRIQKRLNFPVIIRASRTLGGSGGNFAYGPDDFKEVVQAGLGISPVHEVL